MFVEIKHDTAHRKWHRLSVSYNRLALIEAVIIAAHKHLLQYAVDYQMNPGMLAVRIVDLNGLELWRRESDATVNHPRNS